MKTKIFSLIVVGILIMLSMPICAQRYICLQNDLDAVAVSSNSHLKLYKNSTLKVADDLKVRIDNMTDAAKQSQKNINGGLIEGAVFVVKTNDNEMSKVHYTDNDNKDRYNVTGVTISVNFSTIVDGVEYLIPYSDKIEVSSLKSQITDLYKVVFKYEESNSMLVYEPTVTDRLPEGAKLVIDETKIISKIKENERVQVSEGSKIRLIISSEGQYYLDEVFVTSDLKRKDTYDPSYQEGEDSQDNTLLYVLGGIVIVLALLLIAGVLYVLNTRKKSQERKKGATSQPNNIAVDLKHIIRQFEGLQGSFNQITPLVNQIAKKLSEEKDIERLNKEIEQQKETIRKQNDTIEEKDATIKSKEDDINTQNTKIKELTEKVDDLCHQLEEANKLDKGTLIIAGGQLFAQKVNGLLTACRKGEDIIKQYVSSLPESDNLKMSYFLAKYIKEMPSKSRDQWNGVMSTLSIKGFVNDLEITRYLQSESDQMGWLKKHFIEDLLQSYISPLVIMLDQIRCSKQYGLSISAPSNIMKAISEIVEESKGIGVTVKYKPLFEPITTDDKERIINEIDSDLPKELENLVLVQENVPLYLVHIGVVAEGVKDDKTICIAKL